jgi:hypothetical protein
VWPPHLFSIAFAASGFIKAASSTATMVTNLRQEAHQKGASLCRMTGLRISRRVVFLSLFIFHPSYNICYEHKKSPVQEAGRPYICPLLQAEAARPAGLSIERRG